MSRVFLLIFLFSSLSKAYCQGLQLTDILENTSVKRSGEFYFGTLDNLKSEAKIRTLKRAYPKRKVKGLDSAYFHMFSILIDEWECDAPLAKRLADEVHAELLIFIDEIGNIDGIFYSIREKEFSEQSKAFVEMIFSCISQGTYSRIDRYGKHHYDLSIGI
ncbi:MULTISPECIES: hypothetical protein [unclassified Imperialibacter]|uniref:hypothetical protein n=1 Tax=unclassified Imperialibacter TaxID=2629706 RepID=UPI00125892A0|nr:MULTISPECIES: hypothetical protein [unclassified Imperialibacter]CAD5249640.1 exported hypothetical protein [Imperialibacter sp. 89]CAD5264879.1 exported hypothetical protein [Imperialibacter sp. 75]VVT06541.1 exported hypothetical protein [Imperialibacter sp. EC-SDR9]